jgi:HAD superfamily hydrolase (TIGR01549 family)
LIIFDLDQTLIDSIFAKPLRDRRQWNSVYKIIHKLLPFKGINDLLSTLQNNKIPLAIVTSSPKSYCRKIVDHNGWKFDTIVAYHDTSRHKPHPAPILAAIQNLSAKKNNVVSIGDEIKDIEASKAAGVISIAALWGIEESLKADIVKAKPHYVSNTVEELSTLLFAKYSIKV